jgi:hypothetical protein
MANNPTITTINDTFTEFKDNVNTISLDLGATGRLNTNEDSDVVSGINELELGIRGTSNNLVATDLSMFTANNVVSALIELDVDIHGTGGGTASSDLTTSANDVVSAINEIEGVFDASELEISAGVNAFDVVSGTFTINSSADINLDADGGDVVLKDDGTTYGSLTNSSGNLIIKSGTSTLLTGSGENGTFNNNLTVENNLTVTGQTDLNGHVNLGDTSADNVSVVGRVDTNIIPDADGTYDLGSSSLEWNDAFFDGTVTTDALVSVTADLGNFDITSDTITNPNDTTLDIGGDLEVNVDGGDIVLKDGAATFGGLTNTSGNLIVKSGTTTALTFAGANLTTAGTVATGGNITVGGTKINRTGALTLDVSGNISLDADGGNVYLKDDGTTYGNLKDSSGQLIIQSGGVTSATFDSADVSFAGTVEVGSLDTTATNVRDAINELYLDINNVSDLNTNSQNVVGAINEHETDLGTMSLDTTATNVTAAINELHTTIGTVIDSDGLKNNLIVNNIGGSLYSLDSSIGDLDNFDDTDVSDHSNIVNAINAVAADVTQLSGDNTAIDTRIGSLSNLDAGFTGTEDDSIVNALNALYNMIPDIYDESGTLLN